MSIKENHPNDLPEIIPLSHSSPRTSSVSSIDLEGANKGIIPRNGDLMQVAPNTFSYTGGVYIPVAGMELKNYLNPKNENPIEKKIPDGKDVQNIPLGHSKLGIGYNILSDKDGKDSILYSPSKRDADPFSGKDPINFSGQFYKNSVQDPLPVSQFIRVPQSFNNPSLAGSNQLSSSRMVLLTPNSIHVEAVEHRTSPSPIMIKDYPIPRSENELGVPEQAINGLINNPIRVNDQESDDSISDLNGISIGIPLSSITLGINLDQQDEERKISISSEDRQNSDRNTYRKDLKSGTSIESSYSIRVYQDNYNQNIFMFSCEALSYNQIIKQMVSQPYKSCELWSKPSSFKKLLCCFTSSDNTKYTSNQEQNAFILIEIGSKKFNNENELHRNIFMSYYVKYFKNDNFENTPSMWSELGFSQMEIDANELSKNGIILSILHFIYMNEKRYDIATRFIELVKIQAQESFLLIENKLMENSIKNLKIQKLNRIIFNTENVFENFFEFQTRILNAWVISFDEQRNLLAANREAMRKFQEEITFKK